MPSHKIHLALARKVNEKLHRNLDALMLGSVLPDLTTIKNHHLAHYQVDGSYEEKLANPDKFVKEYKQELTSPVMLGYLIHIITDRFYNDYFYKNYGIFDRENHISGIKLKSGKIGNSIKKYKQGDFGKYDLWLLKHHYVSKFDSLDCIDYVKDLRIGTFDKTYLKEYITKANIEVDKPKQYHVEHAFFYKVMKKKEMDQLFEDCFLAILKYIQKMDIQL